jgi:regulator of protease activity HflC (stomatin/prohibitin superfamily)
MFDKLIEFLLSIINEIIPWVMVEQYNKAICLRFGKFNRKLEPGFRWKIPYFEKVLEHTVVTTTLPLPPQSLITSDKKPVVIKAIIKYNIEDIETFLLEIWDPIDALSDMSQGIIKNIVVENTLEVLNDSKIDAIITTKAKKEAKKWGIDIEKVTITNFGEIRSIRLFMNELASGNEE